MRAAALIAVAAFSAEQVESKPSLLLPLHLGRPPSLPPASARAPPTAAAALQRVTRVGRGGGANDARAAAAAGEGAEDEIDDGRAGPGAAMSSAGRDRHDGVARGGDAAPASPVDGAGRVSVLGLSVTPQALATLSMACCMSLHYLSYSLARPATMTLFTSARLGFGASVSAYPFAMTFIGPVSFLLLLCYGGILERRGPALALQSTTLGCAAVLGLGGALLARLDPRVDGDPAQAALARAVVGALFVFRESYVQLVTSQHWSFMSSVLTPGQSATWFAPISGLTSVTSALAALGVGRLSGAVGLPGVLGAAALVLGGSLAFGRTAYAIAERHGFNPADEHYRKKIVGTAHAADGNPPAGDNLFAKARGVFARVPVLWALFCEILACQGLSTLLNVLTVTKVSEVIPDDTARAGWMGKFFATVNILSCVLQFGVLPAASSLAEPSTLWRGMPMVMLAMTSLLAIPRRGGGDPALNAIATAFLVMKTLEFSVRRMLDELVYVPLDYESRFLGKEVIGVLGYRIGKSVASLALSGLAWGCGGVGLRGLARGATGAAGLWLGTAWRLGALVPTRAEAEAAYDKMKKES